MSFEESKAYVWKAAEELRKSSEPVSAVKTDMEEAGREAESLRSDIEALLGRVAAHRARFPAAGQKYLQARMHATEALEYYSHAIEGVSDVQMLGEQGVIRGMSEDLGLVNMENATTAHEGLESKLHGALDDIETSQQVITQNESEAGVMAKALNLTADNIIELTNRW